MPRPFRFGLVAASAPSRTIWVSIARRAEELGYATLLIPDRTSGGILAPIPALAVAASVTTSLRVGSYVLCNGYRHPVLLAREAATLDLLCDGRFELGLGSGVSSAEFEQMGIPFAGAGTRVGQLEETIQLMKQLFTQETVNFSGKHYTVTELKGEADLELSQTIYDLEITDSVTPLSSQAGGWFVPKRPLSTEQAVAHLLAQRDRYGFSYLQVSAQQMENFAPVVARLSGK